MSLELKNTHEQVNQVSVLDMTKSFNDHLQEIMDSRNFKDVDQEASVNEPVIGTMTDYERALFTLMMAYNEEHDDLVKSNRGANRVYIGEEPIDKFKLKLKGFKSRGEASSLLLWDSINRRHADASLAAEDSTGIGIRNGFQIVLYFEDDDHPDYERLNALLATMLFGHVGRPM